MAKQKLTGSQEVTRFLADLKHPLEKEIEQLRKIVLSADKNLTEHIKWNAPSFCFKDDDRITMRIHPPKQIQLIFHRGAKVQELPKDKLINDSTGILVWKTNDRAVATFINGADIKTKAEGIVEIINNWIKASAIS